MIQEIVNNFAAISRLGNKACHVLWTASSFFDRVVVMSDFAPTADNQHSIR